MVFMDGDFLGILIGLMIFLHALLSGLPLSLLQAPSLTPGTMQKMIIPAGVVSGLLGSLTSMYSFPSLQLMLMMRVPKDDLNLLLGAFLSLGYIALWIGILKTGFPVGNNFADIVTNNPNLLPDSNLIERKFNNYFNEFSHF